MANLQYDPIPTHIAPVKEIDGAHIAVSPDNHYYILPHKGDADVPANADHYDKITKLRFIHLTDTYGYLPGITDEQLVEVLINRTEYFQTKLPCQENMDTLEHLYEIRRLKAERTARRQAQGVEGTHQPHKGE